MIENQKIYGLKIVVRSGKVADKAEKTCYMGITLNMYWK